MLHLSEYPAQHKIQQAAHQLMGGLTSQGPYPAPTLLFFPWERAYTQSNETVLHLDPPALGSTNFKSIPQTKKGVVGVGSSLPGTKATRAYERHFQTSLQEIWKVLAKIGKTGQVRRTLPRFPT